MLMKRRMRRRKGERVFTYLLVEDSIVGELSQSHIRCLRVV
jgi:ribosomal protein L32